MPISVDQLTTEVTVEPEQQLGGAPSLTAKANDLAAIRAKLVSLARLDLRIRAEGFDD